MTEGLTGVERKFQESEVIVSKTDPQGRITYANEVFQRVSGYSEAELLYQPHSIIRHPAMPRAAFKLLWDTIQAGQEIFAYVINRAKNGDHYWVFANVTPTFGRDGTIISYHSNRRSPKPTAIEKVKPLYEMLVAEEMRHRNPKAGLEASVNMVLGILRDARIDYDEFVLGL